MTDDTTTHLNTHALTHSSGINETLDVLSSVNSSTMALTMSFTALQSILNTTSMQVSSLITDCEGIGGIDNLCDMIPRPQQFQTEADFTAVSKTNIFVVGQTASFPMKLAYSTVN